MYASVGYARLRLGFVTLVHECLASRTTEMALQRLDGMSNDGDVWCPRNLPLASSNLAKKFVAAYVSE